MQFKTRLAPIMVIFGTFLSISANATLNSCDDPDSGCGNSSGASAQSADILENGGTETVQAPMTGGDESRPGAVEKGTSKPKPRD